MRDPESQLRQCCRGRVCFVALGSTDAGDDAFGILLARKLAAGAETGSEWRVLVAGVGPERCLSLLTQRTFDNVVFLDAAEIGAAPGSVALLNAEEMNSRNPQVSTHRISLGLLAKMVEGSGPTKAWLLAAQPESLRRGAALSEPVAQAVELVHQLLARTSEEVPC